MGEFIQIHRKEKGISQEEFGKMFEPKVNRAAVSKWEKGHVTNIKRSQIQRMCEIFNCKPSDLMCFDEKYDTEELSKGSRAYDLISECFGEQAAELVRLFDSFNEEGKERLLNTAEDMSQLDKYKKESDKSDMVEKEA